MENDKLKISFNMYEKNKRSFKGTLFDLFSGKGEVLQTKALAYVLSKNHNFLMKFADLVLSKESKKDVKNATKIEVIAELISKSNKRADIVIRFWDKKTPLHAIVIEAKGVGVNVNINKLNQQMLAYLTENFSGLTVFEKKLTAVFLTKRKVVSEIPSITWSEVVSLLDKKLRMESSLLEDLFKFLTKINKGMKYYDTEVRSIPAGKSIELIKKHYVYTRKASCKIGKPLFVTFRESGGVMESLYKVLDEVELTSMSDADLLNESDYEYKDQAIKYINDHEKDIDSDFLNEPHILFILSRETIPLKHKPKPRNPKTQNDVIYSLKEILTNDELTPFSQQ